MSSTLRKSANHVQHWQQQGAGDEKLQIVVRERERAFVGDASLQTQQTLITKLIKTNFQEQFEFVQSRIEDLYRHARVSHLHNGS